MPHVIVKLWPGKSETQKQRLAEAANPAVTASRVASGVPPNRPATMPVLINRRRKRD